MSEVTSFGEKMLPDTAHSAKLLVTRFGCLTNETFHRQCDIEQNAKDFDRDREWDSEITKLKDVDGNGGQFLFGSDKKKCYGWSDRQTGKDESACYLTSCRTIFSRSLEMDGRLETGRSIQSAVRLKTLKPMGAA